jgi:hypothetical protein
MARRKAVGERGSWFATVGDERLPCVHAHWVKGTRHSDPGFLEGEGQWPALTSAIRDGKRVILTKDEPLDAPGKKSGVAFNRTGYIAVFEIDNVETNDAGLHFDLVRRVEDLA